MACVHTPLQEFRARQKKEKIISQEISALEKEQENMVLLFACLVAGLPSQNGLGW